jgi:hypothetical protein
VTTIPDSGRRHGGVANRVAARVVKVEEVQG